MSINSLYLAFFFHLAFFLPFICHNRSKYVAYWIRFTRITDKLKKGKDENYENEKEIGADLCQRFDYTYCIDESGTRRHNFNNAVCVKHTC